MHQGLRPQRTCSYSFFACEADPCSAFVFLLSVTAQVYRYFVKRNPGGTTINPKLVI